MSLVEHASMYVHADVYVCVCVCVCVCKCVCTLTTGTVVHATHRAMKRSFYSAHEPDRFVRVRVLWLHLACVTLGALAMSPIRSIGCRFIDCCIPA